MIFNGKEDAVAGVLDAAIVALKSVWDQMPAGAKPTIPLTENDFQR